MLSEHGTRRDAAAIETANTDRLFAKDVKAGQVAFVHADLAMPFGLEFDLAEEGKEPTQRPPCEGLLGCERPAFERTDAAEYQSVFTVAPERRHDQARVPAAMPLRQDAVRKLGGQRPGCKLEEGQDGQFLLRSGQQSGLRGIRVGVGRQHEPGRVHGSAGRFDLPALVCFPDIRRWRVGKDECTGRRRRAREPARVTQGLDCSCTCIVQRPAKRIGPGQSRCGVRVQQLHRRP